jgi:hypothetical protein
MPGFRYGTGQYVAVLMCRKRTGKVAFATFVHSKGLA